LPNLVIEILELDWKHPRERKMGKLSMYRTRWLGFLFNSLIYSTLPAGQVNLHVDVRGILGFLFLGFPISISFPNEFFFSKRWPMFTRIRKVRDPKRGTPATAIAYGVSKTQNPRRGKKIEKIRDNKNLNFFFLPFYGRETDRMDRPWKNCEEKEGKTEMECV
jgi:hypothetical protein